MSERSVRSTKPDADPSLPAVRTQPTSHYALGQRRGGPRSVEEAEALYIAARDEWIAAMRSANSGRPADLASLAIAQEAYEAAASEHERWTSGNRVAVPLEPPSKPDLGAVIGQELAWRALQNTKSERRPGFMRRLTNRLRRK